MFLFDTDCLTILKQRSGGSFERLSERVSRHSALEFFISIVSFHEQVSGWNVYVARAKDQRGVVRGYEKLEGLLLDYAQAQLLPYDEAAASLFDELRKEKVRVGTMDLRIATIAISNNMTLLTRNTVDFERIPGLTFEDWT